MFTPDVDRVRESQLRLSDVQSWRLTQRIADAPFRQIMTPGDLEKDQDIALLVAVGSEDRFAAQALLSLSGILRATVRSTRVKDAIGVGLDRLYDESRKPKLVPQWRGQVAGLTAMKAEVWLTHGYRSDFNSNFGYIGHPEGASPLKRPYVGIEPTYVKMGLEPIPKGEKNAGLWLPCVTVAFRDC